MREAKVSLKVEYTEFEKLFEIEDWLRKHGINFVSTGYNFLTKTREWFIEVDYGR